MVNKIIQVTLKERERERDKKYIYKDLIIPYDKQLEAVSAVYGTPIHNGRE